MLDAHHWCTQVFLDVEGERSQRRHVQHASGRWFSRVERDESIDCNEECRQRLSAAGWCRNERVITVEDACEAL
jgi:hypothetical protein